ncbi:MAG TPA: ribosome recycling factor [candidate division Zixibacteria bacterium]|nr:ribosome recycling factor [candidate division Zixibacteria bacterium]HBY99969.1 ribosome recycling factor [candidate division Zixibacteria bacterium]
MLKEIYQDAENRMNKTLEALLRELSGIRTGKATTNILDAIKVDYYGTLTPLKQVASVSAPDPKMLVVQPWEKNMIPEVVKAIQKADLGLNPISEGGLIRLPIPPLNEERRREMVKLVKKFGEEARVAVRNVRRDSIEALKKAEKDSKITEDELHLGQKHLQDSTDGHITKIDKMLEAKEAEVMAV